MKEKPVFHRRIFWDVDFDRLDYDGKSAFIIERVFNRGDVQDIRNCRRYYGDKKVIAALLQAKYLSMSRIHLVSAIFNKSLNDFRCYTLMQSNPLLCPY